MLVVVSLTCSLTRVAYFSLRALGRLVYVGARTHGGTRQVCVNLIPYNDAGHPTFRRPSRARVDAFQVCKNERGDRDGQPAESQRQFCLGLRWKGEAKRAAHNPLLPRCLPHSIYVPWQRALRARGCFTFVRVTHGDGDLAACGQLATAAR